MKHTSAQTFGPLFDLPPPTNGVRTSDAAAADTAPRVGTRRARVLALIVEAGDAGMTSDELQQATGILHQSMGPILWALEGNPVDDPRSVRLIRKGPDERPTRTGSKALVYRAV